jgi:hypothetical protein
MAKQSGAQKRKVGEVMHEFKHGDLDNGHGGTVRNGKQAIAIALSEAGTSNRQTPARNRRQRARTEGHEQTRQALYAEAARRKIPGRSKMSKAELEKALH